MESCVLFTGVFVPHCPLRLLVEVYGGGFCSVVFSLIYSLAGCLYWLGLVVVLFVGLIVPRLSISWLVGVLFESVVWLVTF